MNEHRNSRRFDLTATTACVGALCLWSLGPIFIKYLAAYLDAWTQNVLRYSAACLFWLPFLLYSIHAGRFDKRTWRRALLPAATNIIMQSLWAAAFYYINPAFMTLLTKTNIIWIAALSVVMFPEERALIRSRRFWIGLLLCITGVAGILYFKSDFAAHGTITGVVIALVCALMWGIYTVTARIAFRDIDSRHGFSVICIYTVIGLGIFAAVFGDFGQCAELGAAQWAAVGVSAVLCIALAHVFYYAAMRRIGATIPALVILAQPFAVLAISRTVFAETLNIPQLIFGATLLIGAAIAIWAQEHLGN
ncbi:MAG: DMT family transporter [Sedimentisphaerales bacterium]|nr:DMT family transporter [Sedimentisphaerales bacterium]